MRMTRASEWAARVAAWRASGMSGPEYCKDREYTSKTLQWWASKLRHQSKPVHRSSGPIEAVRLARVVRIASAPALASSNVVVQVGGARVEVSNGTDRATLAVVFQALGLVPQVGAR